VGIWKSTLMHNYCIYYQEHNQDNWNLMGITLMKLIIDKSKFLILFVTNIFGYATKTVTKQNWYWPMLMGPRISTT
jgi:hypothetical protein